MKGITQNEAVGLFAGVIVVAVVFFASRANPLNSLSQTAGSQAASVVVIDDSKNSPSGAEQAILGAMSADGKVSELIIEDIKPGTGRDIQAGDTVSVHYIGNLLDGTTFDSSYNREPYTFTVGAGDVIRGWDEGVVGMKEGGERILVIPAEFGYGARQVGPIPPNSTLLFKIEALSID
jgi:FKBP-type peptidyl-prolyl cis-trans isomerase